METKKAMSGVVSSVLMIAITISLVAVVWGVVNNLVLDKADQGAACSDIFGKIEINGRFTCYNSTSNQLVFSIIRKDTELDSLKISIESKGNFKTLDIKEGETINGLEMYAGSNPEIIKLPEKHGGYSYKYDLSEAGITESPDSISVAPVIKGQQCSEIDNTQGIESCSLFVFN